MADRHSKLSSRGSVPCRACHRIERAPPPVEEQDRSKPALAISTPNSLGRALDSLCCRHPFEIRFEDGEGRRSGRIRRVGLWSSYSSSRDLRSLVVPAATQTPAVAVLDGRNYLPTTYPSIGPREATRHWEVTELLGGDDWRTGRENTEADPT